MILRAGRLLRPDEPPVRQAELLVDDAGRIARIGERGELSAADCEGHEIADFGPDALIIPGLVNAHTHLELSYVAQPVSEPSFVQWLQHIIDLGRNTPPQAKAAAVAEGVRRSLAEGVTCVGDISYCGNGWRELLASPIRSTRFVEIFGHDPEKFNRLISDHLTLIAQFGLLDEADRNREHETSPAADHRAGLSPHAPYSASPAAFAATRRAADIHRLPLATHLHETTEEIQLYRTGGSGDTGNTGSGLQALMPAPPTPASAAAQQATIGRGRSPIQTLDEAGFFAAPALVAHGNYLDDADIEILCRSRSTVVYCPQSHAHFAHAPHPVERLLKAGVNVALGTDSLASSPSLSILQQMRTLARLRPEISPQTILKMATSAGAVALGRDGLVGRLAVGEAADVTILRCPADADHDAPDDEAANRMLFDERTRVEAVFISGRKIALSMLEK